MKFFKIIFFTFLIALNVHADPIKTEKIKAGIIADSGEWASAVKSIDNKVEITFEFLIDDVEFISVKDLNSKSCSKDASSSIFNAKFNPNKNLHRISTVLKGLCFISSESIYLTYLIIVRTSDKKYYQNTSSVIVYTPKNRSILFNKKRP